MSVSYTHLRAHETGRESRYLAVSWHHDISRYIESFSILVSKRWYSRYLSRYRRYRTALVRGFYFFKCLHVFLSCCNVFLQCSLHLYHVNLFVMTMMMMMMFEAPDLCPSITGGVCLQSQANSQMSSSVKTTVVTFASYKRPLLSSAANKHSHRNASKKRHVALN